MKKWITAKMGLLLLTQGCVIAQLSYVTSGKDLLECVAFGSLVNYFIYKEHRGE